MRNKISIKEYLNTEVKDYAKYVLYNRAIPNIIDGLKPSQRKLLYTATKIAKNKKVKTAALSGACINMANYHHGNASLDSAATTMAMDWKNQIPLFDGKGNFGSRLVNEPAASRYTAVQLSESFNKYFKDNEILFNQTDPEDPEPLFYLPLIPWVLVNGVTGIATGFATKIFPRNVNQIIDSCIKHLESKPTKDLIPTFPNFRGDVKAQNGKYIVSGTIERQTQTKLSITELPLGIERDKYLEHLEKLKNDKSIVRYTEECSDNGFLFHIVLPNSSKDLTESELFDLFKLQDSYTENITVIDESGSLKVFDKVQDLIKHFVNVRLGFYKTRYERLIRLAQDEMKWLLVKSKFIKEMMNEDLNELTRKELKSITENYEFSDRLFNLKIYNFNKDEINNINNKMVDIENDIKKWQTIDYTQTYINELKLLK